MNLMHGDCLELMKTIPDNSIDMVLTDPPYGVTQNKAWDTVISFVEMWKQLIRVTKENGAICLFSQGLFTAKLQISNEKMWRYNLIWIKDHPKGFLNANRMPLRCHEDICIFYKKLPLYNPQKWKSKPANTVYTSGGQNKESNNYGKHQTIKNININTKERFPLSYLTVNGVNGNSKDKVAHPTQKPVELLEYLVKTYTIENETVLDFTMGSGSTGVACKNLNRHFTGIEKEEKYFNIAKERIN